MIPFDNQHWTREEAMYRVTCMIDALTDPQYPDDRTRKAGEKRLLRLLKAIREEKSNEVAS